MITVIIPVLNEEETISEIVKYALSQKNVSEVLVVDDKSVDGTVALARQAGARVITSTKLGKGASMKDGMLYAINEIIVFLDGDILPYPQQTITSLTQPILNNTHDFVKATFNRNAGRVTELVAKPLLHLLLPRLATFEQPLSGMIAGRKSFFEKIDFYDDYGVDIGILIDMFFLKARIAEVNIGYIENKSRPWQELGKMSREVSRAIIAKAGQNQNNLISLEEIQLFTEIRDQMDFAIKESLIQLDKLVIFDMDNTLLQGRFIDECAKKFGFEKDLYTIRSMEKDPIIICKSVARLMKNIPISQVLAVANSIPMVHDVIQTITELKKRKYVVGIISDSYDVVANHIKTLVGADFSLANELEFSKSIATGEVKIPSFFFYTPLHSICKHTLCKTNALLHILKKYGIDINNTIMVGDGENDICIAKNAGIGVSFCSTNELLNFTADKRISERTFAPLLDFAE